MKFKVGDRVIGKRVVDGLDINGKTGIIKGFEYNRPAVEFDEDISGWSGERFGIKAGRGWYCFDDSIELLDNQIVVYARGLKTIALLKEGNKIIKSASAKYNPNDAKEGLPYDFNIGAKWAFSRLIGEEVAVKEIEAVHTSLTAKDFKIGDKVRLKKDRKGINTCGISEETVRTYEGKVYEIENINTREDRYVFLSLKNESFAWNSELFELATETNNFKVGDKVKVTSIKSSHCFPVGEILELVEDGHYPTWKAVAVNGKRYGCNPHWFVGEDEIELYAEQPSSFDWQSFKSGKFAVHCDTEEKAREFLKECDEQGIKWCTGTKAFEFCVGATGYCCFSGNGRLEHSSKEFYASKGKSVIAYTPLKSTTKEIKRVARIGEWVKVLNLDCFTDGDCKVGDIFKTVKPICEHPQSNGAYYGEDPYDSCKYISFGDYVVLENYVPEDKPIVREVKRPAKVGEWVKVVGAECGFGYVNGDMFEVEELKNKMGTICKPYWVASHEYVVLENYQPDTNSLDGNHEPEQPISSTSMREVRRLAKPGEYVKVVNATNIPRTNGKDEYANGDILKIIACSSRYADGKADDGRERILHPSEYVVLEDFDYSVFSKNEPFRKAKVGDKIKIVKHIDGHGPEVKIGDIHTVEGTQYNGVTTDLHNVFYDKDTEYIIINEINKPFRKAKVGDIVEIVDDSDHLDPQIKNGKRFKIKSVDDACVTTEGGNYLGDNRKRYIIVEEAKKPFNVSQEVIDEVGRWEGVPFGDDATINVGDVVKVIDNGNGYTTYSEWFERNEPSIGLRYAFAQNVPEEGGYKVIAKHPHGGCSSNILFAIRQDDWAPVYLVSKNGIEKAK